MPDDEGNTKIDEETIPATPLHAYKEGRADEISGDAEKLASGDPKTDHQQKEVEGDDELSLPHEKH